MLPRAQPMRTRSAAHSGCRRAGDDARRPVGPAARTGPDRSAQRLGPVVVVRSAENPPQVPSGSPARIRTRWLTPASRPAWKL
ncbi:hypothetical protein APS67_000322 [Streptomyces sp. AVP053U2]|nr:hypothetical protein APS67_000322 [Streptomyces sp. AVP053U2]